MKRAVRILTAVLVVLLLCTMIPTAFGASKRTTTVLFTHDLHSHFLSVPAADGGESGGYARLATLLKQQREKYPDALTLDAGDFSIGSLFQTLYTTQGAELRTMGAMGYDATTLGNHEFDHTGRGFGEMLHAVTEAHNAAMGAMLHSDLNRMAQSLEKYEQEYGPWTVLLPAIVEANYAPAVGNPDADFIRKAMDEYGVTSGILLERGGVTYGIFGIMGQDSHDCAPTSGFELSDMALAARSCVTELEKQGAEFIICLSHSGTNSDPEKSEDEQLAKAVPGIDLIVSGHTHTTLEEPVVVGDTYIVSCGQYGENLGSITLEWDENGKTLKEYELIPVDEAVEEDPEIAKLVEEWKNRVSKGYLSNYGLTQRQLTRLEDDQLYRVVTGMYSAQMLGTVKSKSAGLLSLEPKMADGSPVTDFHACILRDEQGNEIKEWYALAAYLQSFGEDGVPGNYTIPDGRKDVSNSWNPVELLKNPNWITLTVLAVILAVAVWVVRKVISRRRKQGSGDCR